MSECYEHEKFRRAGSVCPYCEIDRLKERVSLAFAEGREIHLDEARGLVFKYETFDEWLASVENRQESK